MKAVRQYLELLKLSGVDEIWPESKSLETLRESYRNCQKCQLHKGRHFFVYGEGNPHARLMLIGEGPGRDEDESGLPFVGAAGQLLTKMLTAIQFSREEVYIANVVKCRPPNNRTPLPEEATACLPYLYEQIEIIQPSFLLLLGLTAAKNLLKQDMTLGRFREAVYTFRKIPTYVTYHPSALLRDETYKRPAWEDLKRLRRAYDEKFSSSTE
jgi:DNA polymerase